MSEEKWELAEGGELFFKDDSMCMADVHMSIERTGNEVKRCWFRLDKWFYTLEDGAIVLEPK